MYQKLRISNSKIFYLAIGIVVSIYVTLMFFTSVSSQGISGDIKVGSQGEFIEGEDQIIDLDNLIVVYKNGQKDRIKVNEGTNGLSSMSFEEKQEIILEKRNNLAKKSEELESNPDVDFVQPNVLYNLEAWSRIGDADTPNDFDITPTASTGNHWYYEKENIRQVWQDQDCFNDGITCGGDSDIVVAVIDTGLAYETRTTAYGDSFVKMDDMFGSQSINLYTNSGETPFNGIDDDTNGYVDDYHGLNAGIAIDCDLNGCTSDERAEEGNPHDDSGHGSYVTGLIASNVDNNYASVSPAFNVTIMPLKATFPYSGFLGTLEIEASIDYAVANGADIINMSWGGSTPDQIVALALEDAYNAGVILVAASGNDNDSNVDYPARYAYGENPGFGTVYFDVTSVGAITASDARASYSNYGPNNDVVAYVGNGSGAGDSVYQRSYLCFYQVPNCLSTKDYDGGFANGFGRGTSFSSPQVSALYALLLTLKSDLTNSEADSYVFNNTTDIGSAGFDNATGWGVINFETSTNALADDLIPTITVIEPDGAESADQTFDITWTDFDYDDDATIDFYWDTDITGEDGTIINECSGLSEDNLSDSCTFYTAALSPQTVYVYGCISDDTFGPICDYGSGAITIAHPDGTLRDSGKSVIGGDNYEVKFDTDFTAPPIVIADISTGVNTDMAYINVQEVTQSGFVVNLEENPFSYDQIVAPQEISWYAVQTVSNDEKLGIVDINHNWKTVEFTSPFGTVPDVLATLQTNNGSDVEHLSIRNVTTSSFDIRVVEAPGYNDIHTEETVGWIAYENHPTAQNSGWVVASDEWNQVNFDSTFSSPPAVVFSPSTANGAEQFGIEIRNVTGTGFEYRVEEDKAYNGAHTNEGMSWASFPYTYPTTSSGTVLSRSDYVFVPFRESFEEVPIVVADINSENGSDTSDIDIRAVSQYFFIVRVEEDKKGGWNDIHTSESISWYATLPTDSSYKAGRASTTHQWTTVNFPSSFSSPPKVLADIQTEKGRDTIGLDIRNITANSFEMRVDEDTALGWDGNHTSETIGWVAFETAPSGESGTESLNHQWKTINFSSPFSNVPRVLTSRRTKIGADSVLIDIRNVTVNGFEARVEEEPSGYNGIHTFEEISWFADDTN